jgi:hypothetical protein
MAEYRFERGGETTIIDTQNGKILCIDEAVIVLNNATTTIAQLKQQRREEAGAEDDPSRTQYGQCPLCKAPLRDWLPTLYDTRLRALKTTAKGRGE